MKELLPLAVSQGAAGSDVTAAAANKTGLNTRQTAAGGDSAADSTADIASFPDSLRGVLASSRTHGGASMLASNGGKDLPLATQTADASPLEALPIATDMHAQQDPVLLDGVPQGALTAAAESAEPSASAAAFAGLAKQPAQAGSAPVDSSADDAAARLSDRARAVDLPLTLQAGQAMKQADAAMSSSLSLLRSQMASVEPSQTLTPIGKDIAVKAGLVPQAGTRETADIQLASKADNVLNEAAPLLSLRLQMSPLNQTTELAAQKLLVEPMLTPTQTAATDALNASLMRSSPQTALPAESLSTPAQPAITESFASAGWGQGMGKQILWMVNQNISSAEFRLNPANLGPLEVRVDMDNDQVNVAFSSRHADVREAVEQALPKLREMFEEKGMNLSDADVSQHSFAEQREKAFEQSADNAAGFASGLSFTAEGDQMLDQNHQDKGKDGMNAMLNQALVDYYI